MAPITAPKIAIIGAGPTALTLANILQRHSIYPSVFEAAPEIRTQGGTLDLHPPTGQLALRDAGLYKEFMKYARPESDVMKVVTMEGEVLWDENGPDKQEIKEEAKFDGRPEIDRMALQRLLFAGLKEGSISFDKKLKEAVPSTTENGKYDLQFADGETISGFDLVVGADGAWSKVRNLLTSTKPEYAGIISTSFWCRDVHKNPWLKEYVGEGSMMAFGKDRAVQAQRQGDGGLLTYGSLRAPEDFVETCGLDWSNPEVARKDFVDRYFSDISEDLKRLMLESTDDLICRPLYELPVGFTWPSRSGITLIGDAAHVFTPFAGQGVNLGMKDAQSLAQQIVKTCQGEKTLDEAVQDYEQELFPRAEKSAAKTMRGKLHHFSGNGSHEFADMFKSHYYGTQQQPLGV